MESNGPEEILKTRKIYTKEELLSLRDTKLSKLWPESLDKNCTNEYGQWDPVKSFDGYNKPAETIKRINYYESRNFVSSEKSKDNISLRPERRLWNAGCQVTGINKRNDDSHGGYKKSYQNSIPNCGGGDFDRSRFSRPNGRNRQLRDDGKILNMKTDRFSRNNSNIENEKRGGIDDDDDLTPVSASSNNNNSNNSRLNNNQRFHRNSEPEWFIDGPENCNETIELQGINADDKTMMQYKFTSESKKQKEVQNNSDMKINESSDVGIDDKNVDSESKKSLNTLLNIKLDQTANNEPQKRGGSRFQDIFQKEARNNETKEVESFLKACLTDKVKTIDSDKLNNVSKPLPINGVLTVEELEKTLSNTNTTTNSTNVVALKFSGTDSPGNLIGLQTTNNTCASINATAGGASSSFDNPSNVTNSLPLNLSGSIITANSPSDNAKVVNWLSAIELNDKQILDEPSQLATSPLIHQHPSSTSAFLPPMKLHHDSTQFNGPSNTIRGPPTSTFSPQPSPQSQNMPPAPPGLPLMINNDMATQQQQQQQQNLIQKHNQINMIKNFHLNQNQPGIQNKPNCLQFTMTHPNLISDMNLLSKMNAMAMNFEKDSQSPKRLSQPLQQQQIQTPQPNHTIDSINNMFMKQLPNNFIHHHQSVQSSSQRTSMQHQLQHNITTPHLNGPPGLSATPTNNDKQNLLYPTPQQSARPIVKTSNSSQIIDLSRLADINRNYQNAQRVTSSANNIVGSVHNTTGHLSNNQSAHVLGVMGPMNYPHSTQAAEILKTLRMQHQHQHQHQHHHQQQHQHQHQHQQQQQQMLSNAMMGSVWNSSANSIGGTSSNTNSLYQSGHLYSNNPMSHPFHNPAHSTNSKVLDNLFNVTTSTLPPLPAEAKYANQLETENF